MLTSGGCHFTRGSRRTTRISDAVSIGDHAAAKKLLDAGVDPKKDPNADWLIPRLQELGLCAQHDEDNIYDDPSSYGEA
jgi:hypothetical protein